MNNKLELFVNKITQIYLINESLKYFAENQVWKEDEELEEIDLLTIDKTLESNFLKLMFCVVKKVSQLSDLSSLHNTTILLEEIIEIVKAIQKNLDNQKLKDALDMFHEESLGLFQSLISTNSIESCKVDIIDYEQLTADIIDLSFNCLPKSLPEELESKFQQKVNERQLDTNKDNKSAELSDDENDSNVSETTFDKQLNALLTEAAKDGYRTKDYKESEASLSLGSGSESLSDAISKDSDEENNESLPENMNGVMEEESGSDDRSRHLSQDLSTSDENITAADAQINSDLNENNCNDESSVNPAQRSDKDDVIEDCKEHSEDNHNSHGGTDPNKLIGGMRERNVNNIMEEWEERNRKSNEISKARIYLQENMFRKKHVFSTMEDIFLFHGVKEIGFGNWKKILSTYKFPDYRNAGNLKDRWRTLFAKHIIQYDKANNVTSIVLIDDDHKEKYNKFLQEENLYLTEGAEQQKRDADSRDYDQAASETSSDQSIQFESNSENEREESNTDLVAQNDPNETPTSVQSYDDTTDLDNDFSEDHENIQNNSDLSNAHQSFSTNQGTASSSRIDEDSMTDQESLCSSGNHEDSVTSSKNPENMECFNNDETRENGDKRNQGISDVSSNPSTSNISVENVGSSECKKNDTSSNVETLSTSLSMTNYTHDDESQPRNTSKENEVETELESSHEEVNVSDSVLSDSDMDYPISPKRSKNSVFSGRSPKGKRRLWGGDGVSLKWEDSILSPNFVSKQQAVGDFDECIVYPKKKFRKKAWEDWEIDNLIKGIKEFGVGSWAMILDNYKFQNRNSTMIKDKYRNLKKNFLVEDDI